MAKETKSTQINPEYYEIREIKEKKNTAEPIFCGVCTFQGWKNGKMVTEDEYDKAVELFINNPIGRGNI